MLNFSFHCTVLRGAAVTAHGNGAAQDRRFLGVSAQLDLLEDPEGSLKQNPVSMSLRKKTAPN